jgi:lysine 2,3-aminomutase
MPESTASNDALVRVTDRYATAITPAMERLIDPDAHDDPIARQFRPDVRELDTQAEERADPIDDDMHSPIPGVVRRYADRCLFKVTHVCPVYCRFCFRREMVGPENGSSLSEADLERALAYIEREKDLWEVILTGGDPFILSPRRLSALTVRLGQIDHVQVLRWHTRVPVVDPARVSPALVQALRSSKAVYVAVHVNHPRELTAEARTAIAALVDNGIPVLSQTVLLKGVNDDIETLEALMRALVVARVKPYYLHHGDLAPGTGHFRTTIEDGQRLVDALRARASGLCQPTYVLDIPGGACKAPIAAASLRTDGEVTLLRDHEGRWRPYP